MAQEIDDGKFWLPSEFLYDPSSPAESVMGSTETESDEEDYLADLSRKLAQATLEDDLENNHSKSTRVMAGSPQSTLCGCKRMSNGVHLLSAASGEAERQRMAGEAYDANRNHIPPNPNLQFQQLLAAQFLVVRVSAIQKWRRKHEVIWLAYSATVPAASRVRHEGCLPWEPEHETRIYWYWGVLAFQIGAPTEPRKKRGCSTVLLPDRVIQALNLNMEAQTRSNGGRLPPDYEAQVRYRNSVLMAEQRRRQVEKDLMLPQEWTY